MFDYEVILVFKNMKFLEEGKLGTDLRLRQKSLFSIQKCNI